MNTDININIESNFFSDFYLSALSQRIFLPEALTATVGTQTLARRVPRPLLSPWPLSRASEEL